MIYKINCPQCGQAMECGESPYGIEIACPSCACNFIPEHIQTVKQRSPARTALLYGGIALAIVALVVGRWVLHAAMRTANQAGAFSSSTNGPTTVPITGAWGLVLGQRPPPGYEVDSLGTAYNHSGERYAATKPFSLVEASCLLDGTIYEIDGTTDDMQRDIIFPALEAKYGKGAWGYTTNGWFESWTNGRRNVKVKEYSPVPAKGIITVTYTDVDGSEKASQERQAAEQKKANSLTNSL